MLRQIELAFNSALLHKRSFAQSIYGIIEITGCVLRKCIALLQSLAIRLCNMRIGYARVSTQDQDTTAQLTALQSAGCELLFQEKVSGGR